LRAEEALAITSNYSSKNRRFVRAEGNKSLAAKLRAVAGYGAFFSCAAMGEVGEWGHIYM